LVICSVNEHSFIKSFHKKLDPSIKIWKIYDPYQGGVPDALLFGCAGQMLFVEYKYVKALPKKKHNHNKTGFVRTTKRMVKG
jgi:hypothetical protein